MLLEGSCQCEKVKFRVESETPVPFMFCFCSICRKTTGGAFGCNIMGVRATLKVTGAKNLRRYHARIRNPGKPTEISEGERWFCGYCGTHLYLLDKRWPEGVWPNAGAIDTPLPRAPAHVFIMTRYRPDWVPLDGLGEGPRYPDYPELSIAAWHEKIAWTSEGSRDNAPTIKSDRPPQRPAASRGGRAPRKPARAATARSRPRPGKRP
jgi:hypothetical protein